jgi:recombination protein RecT
MSRETNLVESKAKIENVILSKAFAQRIAQVAAKSIEPGRLARVFLSTTVANPRLLECTPQSIALGLMKCAVLGLEPDGLMGEAFLVPYGNVATFQAGFKGLCKLARQSGEIDDIWAEVVYEGDEFDEEKGLAPKITHKPCRDFAKRGGLLAAYAVARFKGGATRARVIYGDEIEKVKQIVKKRGGKLTGPWIDHEAEMWKKTVIIRLCKTLPMSVARVAEEVERSEEVGDVLDGSFVGVEQPEPAIEQKPQVEQQQPEPPAVTLTAEQAIERFNVLLGHAGSMKECGDALDWLLPPDDSNPYKLASAQQKACVAAFQARQAEVRNK